MLVSEFDELLAPQALLSEKFRDSTNHLLPEGRALDVIATTCRVSKSKLYALINALGAETTGAFRFWPTGEVPPSVVATPLREITRDELNQRLSERDAIPPAAWDGKVRMSLAGVQDKLMVFLDRPLAHRGRTFLADPPLESTHILKPEPGKTSTPHLVVNEHFCMSLAGRMGLPTAEVGIYRTPRPVLVVSRFDRAVVDAPAGLGVKRLHIIDACQAADLPVAFKYERNFGSGEHVRNIRQGMEPAPWYDLVSVVQYPAINHELAMAYGDAFSLEEVGAFQLADFAKRCKVERRLLAREAARLAKQAIEHAPAQATASDYLDEERAFTMRLSDFVVSQALRLASLAGEAARIKDEHL